MVGHHATPKVISELHHLACHLHSLVKLFGHVVATPGPKAESSHAEIQVVKQATKVANPGL